MIVDPRSSNVDAKRASCFIWPVCAGFPEVLARFAHHNLAAKSRVCPRKRADNSSNLVPRAFLVHRRRDPRRSARLRRHPRPRPDLRGRGGANASALAGRRNPEATARNVGRSSQRSPPTATSDELRGRAERRVGNKKP